MTDREAMQNALEALELAHPRFGVGTVMYANAINALRERLAQPEQKPVALPCCGYADTSAIKWNKYSGVVQCHNCGQTYTEQPRREWQGLTLEQKKKLNDALNLQGRFPIIDAIEAELRGNNV